jgi:hypothetical protein
MKKCCGVPSTTEKRMCLCSFLFHSNKNIHALLVHKIFCYNEFKIDPKTFCNPFAKNKFSSNWIQKILQGLECYPRYLGITRRSCLEAHMVLDMEYREQERLEHGPGGPIFLLLSQTLSCQQYQLPSLPAWACIREDSCSMR